MCQPFPLDSLERTFPAACRRGTIVGGVPAKPIRKRFDDETIEKLEALRWWDWDDEKIKRSIPAIQSGNMAALECAE